MKAYTSCFWLKKNPKQQTKPTKPTKNQNQTKQQQQKKKPKTEKTFFPTLVLFLACEKMCG